jgi:cytochrome c biogenesis protein CcmG, thiol:disulfide interchange protein DsbE
LTDTGQQTWTGAARDVWRAAARHKIISALVALAVVGSLVTIGVVGSSSGAPGKTASPKAPAFSLAALGQSGQRVTLDQYAGKPLIVNFFASWCQPCKEETPLLAKFYASEHGSVALVGLDENDGQANAVAFTKAQGVAYPVGFDPSVTAGSAYGVAALPQTFFLDAQHRIVDRVFGAVTQASLDKGIALATGKQAGSG